MLLNSLCVHYTYKKNNRPLAAQSCFYDTAHQNRNGNSLFDFISPGGQWIPVRTKTAASGPWSIYVREMLGPPERSLFLTGFRKKSFHLLHLCLLDNTRILYIFYIKNGYYKGVIFLRFSTVPSAWGCRFNIKVWYGFYEITVHCAEGWEHARPPLPFFRDKN